MKKSFRFLLLIVVLISSLVTGPVTPAHAASLPAEVNKTFTPLQIDAGGYSVLRVTIYNPNTFPLTNAQWTDDLEAIQVGLFIDDPANVVIDPNCGGGASVTAVPGSTTLSLSGADVPAQVGSNPGSCYIEVRISSITDGAQVNFIPVGAFQADGNDGGTPVVITNTSPATSTITVVAVSPPSLSKTFTPPTIFVGETSALAIRINNNDVDTNLTGVTYTDNLPAGLEIANPVGLNLTNCGAGATVTDGSGGSLDPGDTSLRLNNGTVTPSQDCIVTVNVTGASGPYTIANGNPNEIPAGPAGLGSIQTDQGVTNGSPAQAELTIQPVGIQKAFAPGTIDAGDTSILTITLQNPTGSDYTGVGITDNLGTMGAGFTVAGAPTLNTCGGTITAPIGGTSIALSNGTIPASATPPTPVGTCQISIPVQADLTFAGGTRTNTIPANTLTADQPVTNYSPATANLTVNRALYGTKAYSDTSILVGETSTVTITLYNRSSTALTGVNFTDAMAANVAISGTPASPQCGGTITSVAGPPGSITLAGGTIPADGNCTIVFDVTSSVAGTYDNTIAANTIISSDYPGVGHAAFSTNPDLVVAATGGPVGLTKAFQTNPIQIGATSRLRITITAPADTGLNGIQVTDTLPAGLVIAAAPAPTETCPAGTLVAAAGTNFISFSNLATDPLLAAGANCYIQVYVTSTTPGDYTVANGNPNRIPAGAVVTAQGRTNAADATADLRVSSITTSKAFYPTTVQAGGISAVTITVYNTSPEALTNFQLLDTLPGSTTNGLVVAPYPPSPTPAASCGGSLTAVAGTQTIQLTGATLPAGSLGNPGLCTITLDVIGQDSTPATPSSYQNQIPVNNVSATLPSTGGTVRPMAQANATLNIQNLDFDITKGFQPDLVYGGATSTMTVGLINPNPTVTLTGISFTDDMDYYYAPGQSGIILANPVDFNTGTCGGALTGNPGDSSFSFSGGVLPPGASCELTLKVVMNVNGNRINQIPAGAVTTTNGVSNPLPVQASLTNLPGVSITKTFNPDPVVINESSTLTLTIQNTGTIPVVNMGLVDDLPGVLPAGLEIADPPNINNTCGGTLEDGSGGSLGPGDDQIVLSGGGLAGSASCVIEVDVMSTVPGTYVNTIPIGALTADGGVTNNNPASDSLTVNTDLFSLGNRVWFDTDNSSTINGAEVGADGVTVQLYAADASGNPTGAPLDTQTTANGGYYRFDHLPAGDYVVVIPANQFEAGGPLAGYQSSGTTINGSGNVSETAAPDADNDIDSDDNGTRQTSGTFSGAVISSAVTLGPTANEPTNDTDTDPTSPPGESPNSQSNLTVDFGFYRQQLGNLVFQDINEDGAYNAADGDLPLSGARVLLFASDGVTEIPVGPDGILGTADDATGGVTTGAGGTYQFSGLPQGNYIVQVLPTGYASTIDTFNAADSASPNTNADNNDNGVGTVGGTASSNVVTLTPGSPGAMLNNTVDNATGTTYNPTVDFGYVTSLLKQIIPPDDATHTTLPNVTIGEIVRYEVAMSIPNGGLTGVQLVDTPQAGLAFVDCVSISLPAGVTSTEFVDGACDTLDGTDPATSNPLIENNGGRITFDFGDLGNSTGSSQTVSVQYSLIVLDILANGDGDSLTNSVTWSWTGGSHTTSAPVVEIVEPIMNISKDATPTTAAIGDIITFTIDVTHAVISTSDAFDVVVYDRIPLGLTFDPASLVVAGTATLTSSSYDPATNTLQFNWDIFHVGETANITFQAVFDGPAPVVNVANVEWTSHEIDPALPGPPPVPEQRSPYNTDSTERWYDPAAPAGVNSYGANASVTINAPAGEQAELPETGFAPGRVTALPEQPLDYKYAQYGDLWLEIPKLGVKASIVGVPRLDNGWDVKWLWDQAGWLQGTSFPTWEGNSVVTGHVYLPDGQAGPFVDLGKLRWGDQVIVHAYGGRYIYEVRTNHIVRPNAISPFKHEDTAWLTLLTCLGYDEGSNTYKNRIETRAVLIKVESE
ncbi:MAG: sortase domain-bontaining protein [Chloroflexota bacterium]